MEKLCHSWLLLFVFATNICRGLLLVAVMMYKQLRLKQLVYTTVIHMSC